MVSHNRRGMCYNCIIKMTDSKQILYELYCLILDRLMAREKMNLKVLFIEEGHLFCCYLIPEWYLLSFILAYQTNFCMKTNCLSFNSAHRVNQIFLCFRPIHSFKGLVTPSVQLSCIQ